jgi:hypothetical protein
MPPNHHQEEEVVNKGGGGCCIFPRRQGVAGVHQEVLRHHQSILPPANAQGALFNFLSHDHQRRKVIDILE